MSENEQNEPPPFTKEEEERIAGFLQKLYKDGCPVCGDPTMHLTSDLMAIAFRNRQHKVGLAEMLIVVCGTCAAVQFFSRKILQGLSAPDTNVLSLSSHRKPTGPGRAG